MDFNRFTPDDAQIRNEMNRIPKWAKAEHLERNVPQKELWEYSEDTPDGF